MLDVVGFEDVKSSGASISRAERYLSALTKRLTAIESQWLVVLESAYEPALLRGFIQTIHAEVVASKQCGLEPIFQLLNEIETTLHDILDDPCVPEIMTKYIDNCLQSLSRTVSRIQSKAVPHGSDDIARPSPASLSAESCHADSKPFNNRVYIFDPLQGVGSQLATELKGHGFNTVHASEWEDWERLNQRQQPIANILILSPEHIDPALHSKLVGLVQTYGQRTAFIMMSNTASGGARNVAIELGIHTFYELPYVLPLVAAQLTGYKQMREQALRLIVLCDSAAEYSSTNAFPSEIAAPSANWRVTCLEASPNDSVCTQLHLASPDVLLIAGNVVPATRIRLLQMLQLDIQLSDIPVYVQTTEQHGLDEPLMRLQHASGGNLFITTTIENDWFESVYHRAGNLRRKRVVQSYLEQIDSASGLPNPNSFYQKVNRRMVDGAGQLKSEKLAKGAAFLYVRLDYFRELVSELGVERNPDIRRAFAFCILSEIAANDLVTSLSDNEFLIFAERDGEKALAALQLKIETIINNYAQSMSANTPLKPRLGLSYILSPNLLQAVNTAIASIQLTVSTAPTLEAPLLVDACGGESAPLLITEASKKVESGGNSWELILREAVAEQRLILLFQPIVSMEGDGLQRYEVLLRLQHEGHSFKPTEFGIHELSPKLQCYLDRWVVNSAFVLLKARLIQQPELMFFIKLSKYSLLDTEFVAWVDKTMRRLDIPAERCAFEVKESAVVADFSSAQASLRMLRGLGANISLADAGDSKKSLALLDHIEVDYIKLHSRYVSLSGDDGYETEVEQQFKKFIKKANSLEISTLACGLETTRSLTQALRNGVALFQGYFLQAPGEQLNFDFTLTI